MKEYPHKTNYHIHCCLHMLSTQFTHSCTCSFVQNMTLFTHLTEYWICIPLHTFCTYTLTLADSGITVSFINYNTIHSTLLHLYKYIYCCSHITMPHHLLIQMYINNHIHTVCINVNIPWTWAVYVKGKIRLVTFLLGCVCPRWKHSFGHCKTSTLELALSLPKMKARLRKEYIISHQHSIYLFLVHTVAAILQEPHNMHFSRYLWRHHPA